jgi:hypothetical protein
MLAAATPLADPLAGHVEPLAALWASWCAREGLQCVSADDMDCTGLTPAQADFVNAFITVWDEVTK